ncbi:MAG: hypothetical protein M0P39_02860 [Rhodocyclaceae bacterium]|nr:hypothetical protein [Rhodocyclaceae bacterium]
MSHPRLTGLAALIAATLPIAGHAAGDNALKSLREEIQRLRESYESRISALEQRLAQTETSAAKAESATAAADVAAITAATSRHSSEAAFNPAISLILSGMYTNLKDNPDGRPYAIRGFIPSNGEVAPPPRSFSLGESELAFAANVDQVFRGQLTLALPPEEGASPTVEEAFIQTLGLGSGLNLKAGRFLSGIGYLNEQHAHAWDFSDAPLAYKAFLGGQQRGEGVQLKWLAPVDTFFETGLEVGRGGSFPSTDNNRNGIQSGSVFAHLGGDVGIENTWRTGLSFVGSKPKDRAYADVDAGGAATANAFSGSSKTWIADFVWKWAPGGNTSERYLKVQGEYFTRRESGTVVCTPCGSGSLQSTQSGWYAQTVYKFAPGWRAGYRYDRLDRGTVNLGAPLNPADFPILGRHNPSRNTVMADWSPSEFSLVRLQYARDDARGGSPDDQFWLHYIVSLGAHGAHKY